MNQANRRAVPVAESQAYAKASPTGFAHLTYRSRQMGAWGTGLFESDAACDVRDAFAALIPRATSVEAAVARVADRHLPDGATPEDERAWVEREADVDTVLALAWCVQQWRSRQPGAGPLMRAALERAERIIATCEGLDEWPPERRSARQRVYRQVGLRLALD